MKHPQRSRAALAALAAVTLVITGAVVAFPATVAPASASPLPGTPETFDVSQSTGGESENAFMTADAQHVVYTSSAADRVPGDTNDQPDIFLSVAETGSSDPFSGEPILVSAPDGAVGPVRANAWSDEAVASMDGRIVAFTSAATNLVDAPSTLGRRHIYVRDTVANTTIRIQGIDEPNGNSYSPDLSDDGRYLVFTSNASNFGGLDTNGASDSYQVDLNVDGNDTIGDYSVSKLFPNLQLQVGTHDAVISGNGWVIAYLSRHDPTLGVPIQWTIDALHTTTFDYTRAARISNDVVSPPSIDATGKAFAYVRDSACDGFDAVVATMIPASNPHSVALGQALADTRSGWVADPQISPDGSRVVWTTTVPDFDFGNGGVPSPPLADAMVRMQEVPWWDAGTAQSPLECSGVSGQNEWFDVVTGSHPSLSATARTIAYQSPEPAHIYALDTHAHEGITVSSTQGLVLTPSFVTEVPIAALSVAALRNYAAALANAPVHRLPVHRLPVHRLPVHRLPVHRLLVEDSPVHRLPIYQLPVHRLPVHRLDIPGGWPQILENTPFADDLFETVTLDAVLTWAAAMLAPGSSASEAERAAAELIYSLTLEDIGIDGSGLDALSLASYVMGNAAVADIPIGEEPFIDRWQALADQQGLGVTVEADTAEQIGTVLADLDAAGLDIASTGIERVVLSELPQATIDRTMLDWMDIDPLLLPGTPLGAIEVSSLTDAGQMALFGRTDVSGNLAEPSRPLLATATFADLVKAGPSVTFGDVLFSVLDAESYPWEQIDPSAIDASVAAASSTVGGCGGPNGRCTYNAPFRFSFDVGPGGNTTFPAPTAEIDLPEGTVSTQLFTSGSGPGVSWNSFYEYVGPYSTSGRRVTVPMADTQPGTVFEVDAWFSARMTVGDAHASARLTTGSQTAAAGLFGELELWAWDEPSHNRTADGAWLGLTGQGTVLREGSLYYEWISPEGLHYDEELQRDIPGPADDEDFYLVEAPPAGKRLVVSTNAGDGQLSLSLYSAKTPGSSAASLGVASAGGVPGTLVPEQSSAAGSPAESGADAGAPVAGQNLIDQAVQRGDGATEVEAASTDAASGEQLLVRVTSGNGLASSAMYSLRVRYVEEAPVTVCSPTVWHEPRETVPVGVSDGIGDTTNTVYLVDSQRYLDTYGPQALTDLRTSLTSLTGTGQVGDTTVQGAVISVDESQAVRDMRDIVDANPCSMEARRTLTAAINTFVTEKLTGHREQISSIVVVGGDDMIPMAPVAQHTAQFNEASHSGELRLDSPPGGAADDPCPEVGESVADPCETPLSAAATGGYILTDDPYGLAAAYESLGGYLYVPSVALGRLAGTPAQIGQAIARFTDPDVNGVLDADSSVTGGYGAWSELPDQVTAALSWRSAANPKLGESDPDGLWDQADMSDALFPASGEAPKIVSINTHADETRMLPGIRGAETGVFDDDDLFTAPEAAAAGDLDGALVFLIGCHAGNNLPAAYYGDDAVDWVDVFASAGGYVGNTGYGLANNVTTALSERLLGLYADWIGVEVDGRKVSAASALMYAKQSYLGGLGLYSGYDEKVLMEAVYYGLPMYTFADATTTKSAPLPTIPELSAAPPMADGLSSAALSFSPSFAKQTVTDAAGNTSSFLTANGQAPAVIPGQPVLPKLVSQLPSDLGVPKGVLITSLTSQLDPGVTPAIAQPDIGIAETAANRTDMAFPSNFATITRQNTPTGPANLLVVTPGRVEAPLGGTPLTGTFETFKDLALRVLFSEDDNPVPGDTTPPVISALTAGPGDIKFKVDGTGSNAVGAVLLIQREGDEKWTSISTAITTGDNAIQIPAEPVDEGAEPAPPRPFRWILQVFDEGGNVAVETNRGHIGVAGAPAPMLADSGEAATITAGEPLRRAIEVTDAQLGEQLTGSATVTLKGTSTVVAGSPVTIETVPDDTTAGVATDGFITRALVNQPLPTPGQYTVIVTVCRDAACSHASFDVTVESGNHLPTSSVTLVPNEGVRPSTVLAAVIETDRRGRRRGCAEHRLEAQRNCRRHRRLRRSLSPISVPPRAM